jgi:chemotaxis protein methyltransferase CheR
LDTETFEQFRKLIHAESGIKLLPEKLPLLASRISSRLRELNIKSAAKYLEIIESDASGEELVRLIDAISTNTTSFYREAKHFELFTKLIQSHIEEGHTSLKVWCAASSSGEEPYTLAITLKETLKNKLIDTKILATDICTNVLKKAVAGEYSDETIAKVPIDLRERYFSRVKGENSEAWSANKPLRDLIMFRKFNLAEFPYPLKGPIDFIFCRNVMIYFDRQLRQQIIDEMTPLLRPGGYLFLSHSENLLGINHRLTNVASSVYRRIK